MTILSFSMTGEVKLTLRGVKENRVLAVMRRWPHWQGVDIEHDPANAASCLAVTLITDRVYEATLREILRRSFGLTFPEAGGSCEIALELPPTPRRRGRSLARP
jgi:hypothetical protein